MIDNGGIATTTNANFVRKNVDIADATDLGGNIGYDNGTVLAANATSANVFGSSLQLTSNDTTYGHIGKPGSGYTSEL